jgi:hypothetical protein
MNNKILLVFSLLILVTGIKGHAQDDDGSGLNTITTAIPFFRISGDPRAAALGDMGVATSPDAWSQQWNAAKYAFAPWEYYIATSYTPYLAQLADDIGIAQLVYAQRLNEQSAFAASLRYFSLGEVTFRQTPDEQGLEQQPNEFILDASYSLKLSEVFSMAVAGRYIRSDLRFQTENQDATAANSFAVDVSGYYQSEEIAYKNFNGRWRAGFNISNIGPKLTYDDGGRENFIPTNLGVGGGFDFFLNDGFSKVSVTAELNKLLVPTPPLQNGTTQENARALEEYRGIGFVEGIFQSFGDAPRGFEEEVEEVIWQLSAEYVYDDAFALRAGYFNEANNKGGRKFFGLGAGFAFNAIELDLSYLFATGRISSPLEGTLRFGIAFTFGDRFDN